MSADLQTALRTDVTDDPVSSATLPGWAYTNPVLHVPEITARSAEKLTMEMKLRRAIERDEFVLHYQPKVELITRQIVGAEALIRWQTPEGLVPPMQFIPLMEETGLILEAGT